MLQVSDLDFEYQDQPILSKVNVQLHEGGLLHLRGANGSGKTTLLKLTAGIYQPYQGQIQLYGKSIEQNRAEYLANLCFVGHKVGINPNLTVREHCMYDVHYEFKQQNIHELAEVFKLNTHLDKFCAVLSAGQRRQVGLLRLWMTKAKLWLLDEPLIALDGNAMEVLMQHIQRHRKNGGAVILSSHQALPLQVNDYQEYQL